MDCDPLQRQQVFSHLLNPILNPHARSTNWSHFLTGEHKDKATFPHLLTLPWASNLEFNTRRFSHFIFWGDWKLPQAIWAVFMMVPLLRRAPNLNWERGAGCQKISGKSLIPFPNTPFLFVSNRAGLSMCVSSNIQKLGLDWADARCFVDLCNHHGLTALHREGHQPWPGKIWKPRVVAQGYLPGAILQADFQAFPYLNHTHCLIKIAFWGLTWGSRAKTLSPNAGVQVDSWSGTRSQNATAKDPVSCS